MKSGGVLVAWPNHGFVGGRGNDRKGTSPTSLTDSKYPSRRGSRATVTVAAIVILVGLQVWNALRASPYDDGVSTHEREDVPKFVKQETEFLPSSNSATNLASEEPKNNTTYWSTQRLLDRNGVSMFQVPIAEYDHVATVACPITSSIYVYDTLPYSLTTRVEEKIRGKIFETKPNSSTPSGEAACLIQENMATEYALLQLFRTTPCRTMDPNHADYFVVPYLHYSHCRLTPGYKFGCAQVPNQEINDLFAALQYYNATTKTRHIFINVYDNPMSRKQIQKTRLKLTSGPASGEQQRHSIVVPIFHEDPQFQPSQLLSSLPSLMDQKKYSFTVAVGGWNKRFRTAKQPRRFRQYFLSTLQTTFPYNTSGRCGGLPFQFISLNATTKAVEIYKAYRESVFCPILPGDSAWQRRFFDVIRCGCIPVVMEWPSQKRESLLDQKNPTPTTTWYVPYGAPAFESYPFFALPDSDLTRNDTAKALLSARLREDVQQKSRIGIHLDYESFVVRVPGNPNQETNLTGMLDAMHQLLVHHSDVIHKRQVALTKAAPALTFGLGHEAHQYDDAFRRILYILQGMLTMDGKDDADES